MRNYQFSLLIISIIFVFGLLFFAYEKSYHTSKDYSNLNKSCLENKIKELCTTGNAYIYDDYLLCVYETEKSKAFNRIDFKDINLKDCEDKKQ